MTSENEHDEDLKIGEIRFFHDGEELRREPGWRLTASENPWEVQLAFDNNALSWWTSGIPASRGLWIQADFGGLQDLTSIVIEQPSGQREWPLSLWAASDSGWQRIPIQKTEVDLTPPKNIRRASAGAMKASGVEWILIRDGDLGADDLRQKAAYWGAVPIGHEARFRLWRLE